MQNSHVKKYAAYLWHQEISVFHVLRYLEDKTVPKVSFSPLRNLLFKTSSYGGTGPLSSWGRKKIAHLLMEPLFHSLYNSEFKLISLALVRSFWTPSFIFLPLPSINWLQKESNSSQLWITSKANMKKDRAKQEKVFWQFDSISCPLQHLMNATISVRGMKCKAQNWAVGGPTGPRSVHTAVEQWCLSRLGWNLSHSYLCNIKERHLAPKEPL